MILKQAFYFVVCAAPLLVGAVGTANATPYTIDDAVTADQNIQFVWTKDDAPFQTVYRIQITIDGNDPFIFQKAPGTGFDFRDEVPGAAGQGASFTFFGPPGATDWKQTIINPDGTTEVFAANIQEGSSWFFEELDLLPQVAQRIPDLAPVAGSSTETIYTAVNLGLYLSENRFGFLDGAWSIGQTLDELGLEIIMGQISGLEGIYWAITPFEFDPDPTGRGFTPIGGDNNLLNSASYPYDIVILQEHSVPAPSPLLLLAIALPGVFWVRRATLRLDGVQ